MHHRQPLFEDANKDLHAAMTQLANEKITSVYSLPISDINIDHEGMVDGTHPNDIGMMRAAGVSVAFQPKTERVRRAAKHVITKRLDEVLAFVP